MVPAQGVENEGRVQALKTRYDFTLSVYGNANGDDSLDEDDVQTVQGIISGRHKAGRYADANADGRIDGGDVEQIKAMLDHRPVAVTFEDNAGVTVTVNTPAKRLAVTFFGPLRPMLHLGGAQRVVGIGSRMVRRGYQWLAFQAYPRLRSLPEIGDTSDPSQEAILLTAPDLILGTRHTDFETSKMVRKNTGIPFMYGNPDGTTFSSDNGAYETWRLMGLILGQKERAEELIDYCENRIRAIGRRVARIPPQDRVKVILLAYNTSKELFSVGTSYEPIDLAGGNNAAKELDQSSSWWRAVEVSPEQILAWNPDMILLHSYSKTRNFMTREDILSNKVLRNVNAVKHKKVYGTKAWSAGWDPATALTEVFYMVKLFYPDRFRDLDVKTEGNRILETFYKRPGLYTWMLENCGDYHTWRKSQG